MLTKVRIEVEEQTVAETVEALAKYEAAITTAEAQRFDEQWPHEFEHDPLRPDGDKVMRVDPEPAFHWNDEKIADYTFELGRELVEEVIEYDPGLPGWRGRIVVAYKRIDSRSPAFVAVHPGSGTAASGTGFYDVADDYEHFSFRPALDTGAQNT